MRPIPWLLNVCFGFWGIPFALFAAYALWAMRRLTLTEIVRRVWVAPLLYVPIRLLVFVVMLPPGTFGPMAAWPFWFKWSLFVISASLGFGYTYAILCYGAFWLGRRVGVLGSFLEPPRSTGETVPFRPPLPPSANTLSKTEYDY